MKKLYRKGTVHPSPPPPPPASCPNMWDQYLSILPAAILTRAAALLPEDREVLAYLLLSFSHRPKRPPSSSSSSGAAAAAKGSSGDHAPQFGCDCFRCYTSYWVRWGHSPNRQLIHEIIEAFEADDAARHDHHAGAAVSGQKGGGARGGRKERRSNRQRGGGGRGGRGDGVVLSTTELNRSESAVSSAARDELSSAAAAESEAVRVGEGEEEASAEKGSQVRRFVSFIGERIWGVWV